MSSQEAFREVLSRLEKRDKARKGQAPTAENIYKTGAYAGLLVPSAGIADYFGQYPNPEKAGEFLPSFGQNVDKGKYFDAAMQFLGATGDAAYTIPGLGTLTGTGLKALALGGKLSKAQLSSLMDGIARFFTNSNTGPRLAAEVGVDTSKLAMSDQGDLFTGSSPSASKVSGSSKTTEKLKLKKDPNEEGAYLLNLNNKEYKISKFLDDDMVHRGEWSIFEKSPATDLRDEGWEWMDTVSSRGYAVERLKEISATAKTTDNLNLGSGSLFSAESKKGRKLLIVSCSDTKCPDDGDMKAMDRYLGPIFQTLKAQGVPPNVDVAIMSAKHGLITADTPLKNYNLKMTKDLAAKFKGDPDQMNRIKNTMAGYDDVIVQGGKEYKDVLRTAAGDINIKEIPGGRGIGDQRELMMNAIAPFRKINTPVYHFTLNPGFTKFDKSKQALYDFGPHVSSTPKGAEDRFVSQVGGVTTKDGELILKTDSDLKGGSIPLKANLTKPFNNPNTNKPFTEEQLMDFKVEKLKKILGDNFTKDDLLLETDNFSVKEIRDAIEEVSKDLADKGFTHVPYVNAFEDKGQLSFEMLLDRPKGKPKVLQGTFAKKDPAAFDDADFMKAEGGVVEMKDKAVNMYRGTQGIEPFIKYMV